MADWLARGGKGLGRIGAGAAMGAGIGSVVPVIGTGLGALIGGGLGVINAFQSDASEELADQQNEQASAFNNTLKQRADIDSEDLLAGRQQRNSLLDFLNRQANPYTQGNAGLMNLLTLQQGAINRSFANAETDARRSLAQRGVLGTAQESSLLRQMALDKARALSAGEAQLRGDFYDKTQGFEQQRLGNQMGLLGALRGDNGANIYTNLSNQQMNQSMYNRQLAQQNDQATGQTLGNIGMMGIYGRKPQSGYGYGGLG